MPTYKLTYFPSRGMAEVSRQLFHLSGTPYEDDRVGFDKWPMIKESMPFGQLPVMEVDGFQLPQSFTIARQFGYAGKTAFEESWVDAVADQYKDYHVPSIPFFAVLIGCAEGDKDKVKAEIGAPKRDAFFAQMEKILEGNASGFLVGDSLTCIDLHIADHVEFLLHWLPGWLDAFPKVVAHRQRVQSIPKIKEWLEMRPKTPY